MNLGVSDEPSEMPSFSAEVRGLIEQMESAEHSRLDEHIRVLQALDRSSQHLRREMQARQKLLEAGLGEGQKVDPYALDLVWEGAHWFRELNLMLYNLWTQYRTYLPHLSSLERYPPDEGANVLGRDVRLRGGLLAVTCAIVRLENIRAIVRLTEKKPLLEAAFNLGNTRRKIPPGLYDRVVASLYDPDHRRELQQALLGASDSATGLRQRSHHDRGIAYLLAVVDGSEVARELVGESELRRQAGQLALFGRRSVRHLFTPAAFWLQSRVEAQLVEQPSVRLRSVREMEERLYDRVRTLDVVLVRDDTSRGSTRGISEAFVHVGSRRHLVRMGFGDHPVLALYAEDLREGLEYLRYSERGLRMVSLDDLLRCDDVVVVRYAVDLPDAAGPDESEVRRLLDLMVDSSFLLPTPLYVYERSARLLEALFGRERLGVDVRPGENSVPLGRIALAAGMKADSRIVFGTLDGKILADSEARGALLELARRRFDAE